ncbi:unnamed protein product [Hyaloperonospora brassicae]|uniref:RxLR effector candidate protein n=1 Tax=Hyaloperonospora brassicae TaxID=162125 RepID=A0AAV0UHR7_HYABA|nr:unnamed protein product [Hyaloperonospora brassicae]
MRSIYHFALSLSSVLLFVLISLATGLDALETPTFRAHAVKLKAAKNLPRDHALRVNDQEDRGLHARLSGSSLRKAGRVIKTKFGSFFASLCNSGTNHELAGIAKTIDEYHVDTSHKRPGVISAAMKQADDRILLAQREEVKRMAMDYYKLTPKKHSKKAKASQENLLDALLKTTNIKQLMSDLRDRNAQSKDAETYHHLRNTLDDFKAAVFLLVLQRNKLERELGARCEWAQFDWWIISERKPEDVLAGFLTVAQSENDIHVAMDIVARYMRYIKRKQMALSRQNQRKAGPSSIQ